MWEITLLAEVEDWFLTVCAADPVTAKQIVDALDILERVGPGLGRPLVDTLEGGRLANLKELRPGSTGRSEIRILFVFDPNREAILLVAGDKADRWSQWYEKAIPLAEERYSRYLDERSTQ